jgi:general secretion pathway protein E
MQAAMEDRDVFRDALAEALVRAGKLDRTGAERARRLSESRDESYARVLTKLGLVSERDLAAAMAGVIGQPLATEEDLPPTAVAVEQLSPRFLKERRVLPLSDEGGRMVLAIADPFDSYATDAFRLATGRAPIIRIAEPSLIEAAIDRLYAEDRGEDEGGAMPTDADIEMDVERLKDLASEAPVVRWVNGTIARAVEMRASDVHIEPYENDVRVRFRLDGVLVEREPAANAMRAAIVSRIKIMARLNIAERRLPQDGRIKMVIRGRSIDLRISTLPTMYGESVVMRILDRDSVALNFNALGLSGQGRDHMEQALEQPNGVFLVTGPTGSGKTTTLYAGLSILAKPEKKIVTVEDPVEYQLDGVNQVQVKPDIGLSFANVLRSILRQDPDIIMVGEIRDGETAKIAAQAALTGHFVLSTLHTNDAASAITRQIDMGVEDYLITSTLVGVSAQRLVRRLCAHCATAQPAMPEVVERFDLRRRKPDGEILLHRPVGCEKCGGRGYSGRRAIVETMLMTDDLRRLVLKRAESRQLLAAAIDGGFRTMFDDGLAKVLAGETTLEEVLRTTRET